MSESREKSAGRLTATATVADPKEQAPGGREWSDEQLRAMARRELIGFTDWDKALSGARERWALFERLRGLDAVDASRWIDEPSQEAFSEPAERWLAKARVDGAPEALADPLPTDSVPALARCAPVGAAGQGSQGSREGAAFEPRQPCLAPRGAGGSEALAQEALRIGLAASVARARSEEWGVAELRASFEARVARVEPGLQALESWCEPSASECARGPLMGMPFIAKSLFWVQGELSTASCAMLSKFQAPIDAPVVSGLRAMGAYPLAMARMDELAMGGDGSRSAWGATRHPWLVDRLPGGSSSGSAAALAAGLGMFAIGSDTGGSIRIPASHCGLWGLKPTYGALSRFGMVPYAFSLDCPGAFTRSAEDMAVVFQAMASGPKGWDERQALWAPEGFAERVARGAAGMRSARPWEGIRVGVERSMLAGCDPFAREAFATWEREAQAKGALLVDVALPSADEAVWAYYLLASCEAQSAIARYDPMRFGWEDQAAGFPDWEGACSAARTQLLGEEPRMRALLGAMALSEPSRASLYAKACALRARLAQEWSALFEAVGMLALPSAPGGPPRAGEALDPSVEWAQDRLTIPASLGGIGAISAPWAQRDDGAPMGIQLCFPWHQERAALSACIAWGV